MRKITTILMGFLLTFTLVLGVMPREMVKADPTSYNLTIAGVEVTSDNLSGDGWSFDPVANRVTLTGNISATDCVAIAHSGSSYLYIKAEEDVTITTNGYNGISSDYGVVIEGPGKITMEFTSSGESLRAVLALIYSIEIANGASVDIHMPTYQGGGLANAGLQSASGDVVINGNVSIDFAGASSSCDYSQGFTTPMGTVGVTALGETNINGGTLKVSGANVGVAGGSLNITGESAIADISVINAGVVGNITMTAGIANIKATGTDAVALTGSKTVAQGATLTLSPNPDAGTGSNPGESTGNESSSSGSSSSSSSSSTSSTPLTSTTQVVQKEDGTTETITTTKISATETIIASSTGVEQRKIAVQYSDGQVNEGIKVAGSTTVIPSGASFSYNAWAMDSPNFIVVQTAIQASGNEELQKATKVQAMEFNLSHSNGTAIHQLGDYVQVSFPLASFYNDPAATVPAGKQLVVYRVEDDGTLTRCNTTVVNGEIIFSTNHFSTYIVVEETARTAAPKTGESSLGFVWLFAIVLVGVSGALFVKTRKNRFE